MRKITVNKELWHWQAGARFVKIQQKERNITYLVKRMDMFLPFDDNDLDEEMISDDFAIEYVVRPRMIKEYIEAAGNYTPTEKPQVVDMMFEYAPTDRN